MLKLIKQALRRYLRPRAWLVSRIVQGTSALELTKEEFRELPPIEGMYGEHGANGAVILRGNSLPELSYQVFDERLMEFVHVTVTLALPDRVEFRAVTDDLGEIQVRPEYSRPFYRLARHLAAYFPLMSNKRNQARVVG